MDKPLLTVRPSIVNALLPTVIKNLGLGILIALVAFAILSMLGAVCIFEISATTEISILAGIVVILGIVPVALKIVKLMHTRYYFFETHLITEYKLVKITKISAPYERIKDITMKMGLWDRMCNAGQIIISTTDDSNPNIYLFHVKDPEKIERGIYRLIKSKKVTGK